MLSMLLATALTLGAAPVSGRITDGQRGLPGVRVSADGVPRVGPSSAKPFVLTDGEGRFQMVPPPGTSCLVIEKPGWRRDFVPLAELAGPVAMHPASQGRRSPVLVVRLAFPDQPEGHSDGELRDFLFSRAPGVASAANYFYEISKGELELVEGRMIHLVDRQHPAPRSDAQRRSLLQGVMKALHRQDLSAFDQVDNATGEPHPDGKPDHLWVIVPGAPGNVTARAGDLTASNFMEPLPWQPSERWPLLFITEETPLGILVHEALHAMGENRVDDYYMGPRNPLTAGGWDVMDAGIFRGWDRQHPEQGPWQQDMGYSPAQPMGFTRAELWYRGAFRTTVSTLRVKGQWEGWLAPLERAPGSDPQRLVVPDPRRRGRFWELSVRRPWGFDGGRVGQRWGAGYEGLVVARIRPDLLSTDGLSRGPVQVLDAHPGTPQPPKPRYPWGMWQLEDAAFNLGPGEVSAGQDGPLVWQVLALDGAGRMRVKVGVN
nr:hypothetical protein [uncultured Holophaga sp.]